jgi:hypothetical protein
VRRLSRRCIRRGLVVFIALFALSLESAGVAFADGGGGTGQCDPIHNTCDVGAAGGGGGDVGDNGGGGGGGSSTDPCAPYPSAAYGDQPPKVSQACADELRGQYCNAIQADALGGLEVGSLADLPIAEIAALNRQFVAEGCPAVVTPATLAEQAFGTIVFPHPSGHRSPSEGQDYNGYPVTYVGLWTFYWTDPATWKPLTATATAAGLTATVTAEPVSLSFDPGDGSPGLSCSGPGRPWVESDGNNAPSDGACGYRYSKVSGPGYEHPITSTQTILWKITWTGTGNAAGEIPALSTSTSGQLNVLQIKTVNR